MECDPSIIFQYREKLYLIYIKQKKFNDIFINTMFGIYASSDKEEQTIKNNMLKLFLYCLSDFLFLWLCIGSSIGGCDDIWYGIIMPRLVY